MATYPFDIHSWQRSLITHGGNVFWVDNGNDDAADDPSNGGINLPFNTLDYAIGRCTAANGDVIYIKPGHAETLTAAGAVTCDISGVTIIGLGTGANRPTFTFGTATTASVVVSAANVTIKNIVGIGNIDALTNPFHIQATDCVLDIEWRDTSATVEAARAVLTTAAADRFNCKLRYIGFTNGDAVVNAVRLVGCNAGRIELDAYGVCTTAWVEFVTTACTDIVVTGRTYTSGITNGSRNVVDTVTGSTWSAEIFDASAGAPMSGGSGSTLAVDDLSAVTDALYGGNGVATYPASAAPANGVSLAEVLGIIYDSLVGTAGIATYPSGAAAANAVSIAEVLRFTQENIIVGSGTPLAGNTSLFGVLAGATGIPTYPAAAAPANSVSLAEVIRAIYDRQLGDGTDASTNTLLGKRVNRTTADVITGAAVPIFTVGTGRVLVTLLSGEVTTIIGAGATNAKFQFNPTTGTTNDICANLDIDADEAGALYSITGTPADAMLRSESGAVRNMTARGIILDIGDIEFITSADRTGSISFQLFYIPLDDGATVVAA